MRDPFLALRRLGFYRHPYRAVRFKAIFIVDGCKQKGEHMNFSIFDNQNGQLVLVAVDGAVPPQPTTLPADTNATSADPTIATCAAVSGFPGVFKITGVKAGTVNVVATGTNAAGVAISTTFVFTLSGSAAVGFTATLQNVVNN